MIVEAVETQTKLPGVIQASDGSFSCQYCYNINQEMFATYFNHTIGKTITYCRQCIGMTYSSTHHYFEQTETVLNKEMLHANLEFELSEQQIFAAESIVEAVKNNHNRLLYAVTGAGKTEMILQGIIHARANGMRVAIVSPRTDVVKELELRMKHYFAAAIDVLYEGQSIAYDTQFVICTMHQLFRFKHHFGLIIVDEIDAFPANHDPRLIKAVYNAATKDSSLIFLTATPSTALLKEFAADEVITLPARYHRRPLIIPTYKFMTLNQLLRGRLFNRLKARKAGTYLLVFFADIQLMETAAQIYKTHFNLTTVSSEDVMRHEKVEAIRNGAYDIIFTTTILERGFTMAQLDVWVIDAAQFDRHTLIQMAGRVDRKLEYYSGEVCFFHQGVTFEMIAAVKTIKRMNALGVERGWID